MKRAGLGAVEATNPVAILYGTVTAVQPLEVRIDQRLTLPEPFLIVPEHMTESRITVDGQEIVIRKALEPGDRLVLMRVQGGQQYMVMGRVMQ